MKIIKRGLLPALCAALLALSACGVSRDDATVYIQGRLDCTYKGTISEDYVELVDDMTEEEAREQYETNAVLEAGRMLRFLGVDYTEEGTAPQEVLDRAVELVKEIYTHAQYTVNRAEKLQSGDFAVEVLVSPIELFHLISAEDLADIWLEVCGENEIYNQEELDAVTEEEYRAMDAQFAQKVMDLTESLLPQLSHGEEQNVMLQLELEDDVYTLVANSWTNLDDMVIDYNGNYLAA